MPLSSHDSSNRSLVLWYHRAFGWCSSWRTSTGCLPASHHRSYSHLVDGDNRDMGLGEGSVLLLHVSPGAQGKIEGGAVDRGAWVTV